MLVVAWTNKHLRTKTKVRSKNYVWSFFKSPIVDFVVGLIMSTVMPVNCEAVMIIKLPWHHDTQHLAGLQCSIVHVTLLTDYVYCVVSGLYTHTRYARRFHNHPSRWTWVSQFPLSIHPLQHHPTMSFSDKRRDGSEGRRVLILLGVIDAEILCLDALLVNNQCKRYPLDITLSFLQPPIVSQGKGCCSLLCLLFSSLLFLFVSLSFLRAVACIAHTVMTVRIISYWRNH